MSLRSIWMPFALSAGGGIWFGLTSCGGYGWHREVFGVLVWAVTGAAALWPLRRPWPVVSRLMLLGVPVVFVVVQAAAAPFIPPHPRPGRCIPVRSGGRWSAARAERCPGSPPSRLASPAIIKYIDRRSPQGTLLEARMQLPSPLHPRTAPLCTSHRWKEWAGYLAVCAYTHSHEP